MVTLNENYDGVVAIDNNDNENRNFTLTFLPDLQEIGNKIYEDANVRVVLDNVLRSIWINGGKQAYNIIEENDTTLKIIGNNATLGNFIFNANQATTLTMKFHFLPHVSKTNYTYHVLQKESSTNKTIGGVTYDIHYKSMFMRPPILDTVVRWDKGDHAHLMSAFRDIGNNDDDDHKWYDSEEELVYEGSGFSITITQPTTYKLVITQKDSIRQEINIHIDFLPNRIKTLHANPASDQVTVNYKVNQGEEAYLYVINSQDASKEVRYSIDSLTDEFAIDLTSYASGIYAVSLIVDGQVEDTKMLIKP